MRIITEKYANITEQTCVTIGKFDGVHRGHARILEELMKAKEQGFKTVVFTFEPSPFEFFTGNKQTELTTREEKRILFERLGIDYLWEFPFDEETANTEPEIFIKEILLKQLHAVRIVAGPDLSFGKKGRGNALLLKEYLHKTQLEEDCTLQIVDKVRYDGEIISSTAIREFLQKGELWMANEMLGRAYSFCGEVLHGRKLGSQMGFPTVNVLPENHKAFPPFGVYYSKVRLLDETQEVVYLAITNIGRKPTISSREAIGVETYLYDFDGDLYGKRIEVSLCEFKRPEQKFEDIEALKVQLQKDIADGIVYFHQK